MPLDKRQTISYTWLVSNELRQLRISKRIRVELPAVAFGVSTQTIRNWESGRAVDSIRTASRIAEYRAWLEQQELEEVTA